ncbi:MAG: LysR family transcriptional regulator [Acidaminococcaceae bacterium]
MLEALKTLVAVVECQGFTKAATVLNLSQPSVSLHIKRLEEEFGLVLLQRSQQQKKFVVTAAGQHLYERSKQLLRLYADTKTELAEYAQGTRGKLHIGATLTIGEYFLPAFLGRFCAENPTLDVQVSIANTAAICQKVAAFEVNIGLIEGRAEYGKFVQEEFYRDELVLIAPVTATVASADPSKAVWITREEGSGSRQEWERYLTEQQLSPRNTIVFSSNYAVKEAVSNGLGLALVSEHIARQAEARGEVQIMAMPKNYARCFSYILPAQITTARSLQAFLLLLKNDFAV